MLNVYNVGLGITKEQIETYLNKKIILINEVDINNLTQVYGSLKSGKSKKEEYFKQIGDK